MATIKFWQEMRKATSVANKDKIMVGIESTGEAMYMEYEDLVSRAGQDASTGIEGVSPGALPTLGSENKSALAQPGTYTQSGSSDIVVPEGSMGILFWDGSEWSLSGTVETINETIDFLEQDNEKPIESNAVLGKFFTEHQNSFKNVTPFNVMESKSLTVTGSVEDNNDYNIHFYVMSDKMLLSNTLTSPADVAFKTLYFFNQVLTYSNTRVVNFFNEGVTDKKNLFKKQALDLNANNRIVGINVPKAFAGNVVEIESKFSNEINPKILPDLIKNSSVNIVDILIGKNFSGNNIINEAGTDIVIIELNEDFEGTFMPAPNFRVGLMDHLKSVLTTMPVNFKSQEVNSYLFSKSYFKTSSRVRYLGIPVINSEEGANFKGDTRSTSKRYFKEMYQAQCFASYQAQSIIDKFINPDGTLGDEVDSITYIVDKYSIPKSVFRCDLRGAYPNVYLMNNRKEITGQVSGNGTYNVDDLECFYFAFTWKRGTNSTFSLESYRSAAPNKIYNILDYSVTPNSIGFDAHLTRLVDLVNKNGGGTIYVPAGTYDILNPVIWKSNVNLKGDGENLTIFNTHGVQSAFAGNNIENFTYSDFSIDGIHQKRHPSQDHQMKGIFQTFLKDVTYRNLVIRNTGATGLGCDFFQSGVIDNVRAYNCGRLVRLNLPSAPGASGIGIGTGRFQRGSEGLVITNCHAKGNGQYGIFLETQSTGGADKPIGTTIANCTAEKNRVGFGCSGADSTVFIGCHSFGNHQSNFAYDHGTLGGTQASGTRPKYIGCVSKSAGRFIPEGYPEYNGNPNGYGWFVSSDFDGIELTNCNSFDNLKSGVHIKNGVKNLFINGGSFFENDEHGIDVNGGVNQFRISPSIVENNGGDGLRIDGNISNGFIKNSIYTMNENGINITSGTQDNVIISDNLTYNNSNIDSNA